MIYPLNPSLGNGSFLSSAGFYQPIISSVSIESALIFKELFEDLGLALNWIVYKVGKPLSHPENAYAYGSGTTNNVSCACADPPCSDEFAESAVAAKGKGKRVWTEVSIDEQSASSSSGSSYMPTDSRVQGFAK